MHDTREDADKRYAFKMKLMREVLKINRDYNTVLSIILYLIDYLLRLPEELSEKLKDTMTPIMEKEVNGMGQTEREFISPTMEGIFARIEEKNTEKIVLEMLKKDFPIDIIAEVTHLDVEAIKKLKETI